MNILIQTNTSSLNSFQFDDINDQFIQLCVNEIEPFLIHNPSIKIYGKVAYQRRSVGFFSNESVGYFYSNQIMKSLPITSLLNNLLDIINQHFNSNFNGILITPTKKKNETTRSYDLYIL